MLLKNVSKIADACLVNSLHKHYNTSTLSEEEHEALSTALVAITAANEASSVMNY